MVVLIFGVKEPQNKAPKKDIGFPLKKENIKMMPHSFWLVVISASLLTMARFSDAFLILKAQEAGNEPNIYSYSPCCNESGLFCIGLSRWNNI